MKSILFLVVLVALVAVLALTNPSKEEFARAYARDAAPEVTRSLGLEGLSLTSVGVFARGAAEGALTAALESHVVREDYGVASLFVLPLPGEDVRVLGVAGQFVPLNRAR